MKADRMNVLLTGASGGIGSAVAELLAGRGARLLLAARNEDRLNRLRNDLAGGGATVETVVADLATADGRARVVAAACRVPGGVNVLINNAGINRFGLFEELTAAELAEVVETNLLAPMLLTHALLPELRKQPESIVANVGSIVGSIGLPGQVAYAGSKFGMHGFSEALRRELCGSDVRVVYVAPRSTDTDMNDVRLRTLNERMGVATDDSMLVARRIVEALEKRRAECFIGWPERLFVKLNALIPGVVDRSLQKQTSQIAESAPGTQSLITTDGAS